MIRFNKKSLASVLLTGSIALSAYGCARDIKDKHDNSNDAPLTVVETTNNPLQYVNNRNEVINLSEINLGYVPVEGDNKYTLYEGATLYFKSDWNITDESVVVNPSIVTLLAQNNTYSLVELASGKKCYVNSGYLIKCPNVHNAEYEALNENGKIITDAYIYDRNGMYIGFIHEFEPCYTLASNGEYCFVELEDGTRGYVVARSVEETYQNIRGYAFIKAGTNLYYDNEFTRFCRTSDDEVIYVEYMTKKYASVFDDDGCENLYVRPEALDDDFILVDLSDQQMSCYIDYQLASSWPTRTGKDSTPTVTGAFDIDEKTTDWEFTTYPGSFAKHWMPIDTATQQGIHDLIGDDEWNYGNESYHEYGSHRCIRVSREASQYVFDNYQIGDYVLVRK